MAYVHIARGSISLNRWTKSSATFTVDALTTPAQEIPSWLEPVLTQVELSAQSQLIAANFWRDAAETIAKVRHNINGLQLKAGDGVKVRSPGQTLSFSQGNQAEVLVFDLRAADIAYS